MKLAVVAILYFTMLCFFALSTFFAIKLFGRNNKINDEALKDLFELFPEKKNKTFTDILIQSNGTVSPGKLSHKRYNFSAGLEFCSSMNMMMLDRPAKIVLSKESPPVKDGLDKGIK